VLTVSSISGNVFRDMKFESLKYRNCERLRLSRLDLEKTRLRCKTNKGTEIGINFTVGKILRHGDVLENNETIIVVEQLPEKVISVRLKNKTMTRTDLLVVIGHIIGNRHRPISIKDSVISFPIQADSELEIFQRLFADMIENIELSIEEMIFKPHAGANVHEHG